MVGEWFPAAARRYLTTSHRLAGRERLGVSLAPKIVGKLLEAASAHHGIKRGAGILASFNQRADCKADHHFGGRGDSLGGDKGGDGGELSLVHGRQVGVG